MSATRRKNTKRNLVTGIVYKFISILLPFLIRTVILYYLGSQYVGLSSLFTSILQVLNLAELGFSSAIVFNLYKPIAQGDDSAVCALLNYYKKVYRIIGSVILVAGLALTPFIPNLIKGEWPSEINIYVLYLLYLTNTAVSYFLFAYKSTLLTATQRMDLVNIVQTVVFTGKYVLQLAVLMIFKNYYAFVVVAIVSSVVFNIVVALLANKKYPQYQPVGTISEETKKEVKKQVGGVMIGKLCDTSRNSFDSIILSAFFGLTVVAIYNNYFYIFSALYGIFLVITQAMEASVGNSIATESTEKNYHDLLDFQLIFSWLSIVCTACMICVYQPFMHIWAGEDLMFGDLNMALFCLYFYVININNMRNLYFTGNGLWWDAKGSFIYEAVGNLILNLVLGYLFGATGVLIATIITIFVFNFLFRTHTLFKKYFKISKREFYFDHLKYFVICVCACGASYFLCSLIGSKPSFLDCVIRGLIAFAVSNIVLFLSLFKSKHFKSTKTLVVRLIRR